MSAASGDSTLDEARETKLWRAHRDTKDENARIELIEHYLPFAHGIALRLYASRSYQDVELAEYKQLAALGLLEAIERFDPERGARFKTYAAYRVDGAIRNGILKATEKREQWAWRRRVTKDRLASIAEDTESGTKEGRFAELASITIELALGSLLEDSGIVAKEQIDSEDQPYRRKVLAELKERIRAAIATLPDREQFIIRHHYFHHVRFAELARLLQISKGRVSQIHRRALKAIRKIMSGGGVDGYY
jgi:RNA polymerase sigma factor for flagellar operon FliA